MSSTGEDWVDGAVAVLETEVDATMEAENEEVGAAELMGTAELTGAEESLDVDGTLTSSS
jgi:hypothetical protein